MVNSENIDIITYIYYKMKYIQVQGKTMYTISILYQMISLNIST